MDRGAVTVETAMVVTLLFTLAVGVVETSVMVLDKLAVGNATREGARVGALAGSESNADSIIIGVVERALCSQDFGSATKVLVYRAEADGGVPGHNPVADPNYDFVTPGLVNTFEVNGSIACSGGGTAPNFIKTAGTWDPASRDDVFAGGLDELGVLILYTHDDFTGFMPFFGGSTNIEVTVMRLEPRLN